MSAWSLDPPTQPGWYWMRRVGRPDLAARVAEVTQENGYLECEQIPIGFYASYWGTVQWQPVIGPKEESC